MVATTADSEMRGYHAFIGSHAPAIRRLGVAAVLGIIVGAIAALFVPAIEASLIGWDTLTVVLLAVIWHVIGWADGQRTMELARREDETRATASLLVTTAALVSLAGALYALHKAKEVDGGMRTVLIVTTIATVLVSWVVVNTVFTLHYAHLYYTEPHGDIDFADTDRPDFRDIAYLAFTIGMTYQVSDTTLRSKAMRRTALRQAFIAYLFGVVIVATIINVVAGFV
jgi:uncharacterized membrane protein